MATTLDIPAALRRRGAQVVEEPGWKTRGRTATPILLRGSMLHHTGTARSAWTARPEATLRVIIDGRATLAGPLACSYLCRLGHHHLVAAGRANHAGSGSWPGLSGNGDTAGLEVEGDGTTYTDAQHTAMDAWYLALHDLGVPVSRQPDHKDWARPTGRKWDRGGVDSAKARARATYLLQHPEDDMTQAQYDNLLNAIQGVRALVAQHLPHVRTRADQASAALTQLGRESRTQLTQNDTIGTRTTATLRELALVRTDLASIATPDPAPITLSPDDVAALAGAMGLTVDDVKRAMREVLTASTLVVDTGAG